MEDKTILEAGFEQEKKEQQEEVKINIDNKQEEVKKDNNLFEFVIKTETGSGAINDYMDHSLNFNKSKSIALIIRALTGYFGALNLAIIDLLMGMFNLTKEMRQKNV